MLKTASCATRKTRSARFLSEQRPKPTKLGNSNRRLLLLPNLTRLAKLASWFGQDHLALDGQIKIDAISDVDELIAKFLRAVNDHYFPINTDFFSDDEDFSHPALQGTIPVRPKGFSNWHYDDPITLICLLANIEEDPHPAIDALEADYPQFDVPWEFCLSKIPAILDEMELDEPLNYLTDLINVAGRRSGTFFLDHTPEEYDFYESRGLSINWSPFNIEWLKADWKVAKPIHRRVWQLINWTMTDKDNRTTVLMELILKAWGRVS